MKEPLATIVFHVLYDDGHHALMAKQLREANALNGGRVRVAFEFPGGRRETYLLIHGKDFDEYDSFRESLPQGIN